MRLPTKPEGGSRLIGLMNTLAKWWGKARHVYAADFEQEQDKGLFLGGKNRNSTNAAFEQAVRAEAAFLGAMERGADHEPASVRSVVVSCHVWWQVEVASLRQPQQVSVDVASRHCEACLCRKHLCRSCSHEWR